MKTALLIFSLFMICLPAHAESFKVQREVRIEPNRSCSLEDFSSLDRAKKFMAESGGELFRDQDTHIYRVIKCNFDINDRVLMVFRMTDG
jgi:hypothetical protein